MRDYNKWLEDNLPNEGKSDWLKKWRDTPQQDPFTGGNGVRAGYTPYTNLSVTTESDTVLFTGGASQDPRDTTCFGQNDCAIGFSCVNGSCIQVDTENGGGGGCGTGGAGGGGTDDGFGCIEIGGGSGGGGGCTTGTCGDNGDGGPGGAEYCCGDWVCSKDIVTGEFGCECVPYDPFSCSVDTDCPDGYTCVDGYCIFDFTECSEDSDCPEGYYCSGGFCLYDFTCEACNGDGDCDDGYSCQEGCCQFDFGGCDSDEGCPEGEICFGGFCTPGCTENNDCPDGEICSDGFCVPGCSVNSDCPDGEFCSDGFCFPGCSVDLDCPDGETCLNGYCRNVCSLDTDCPDGEICYNGFCVPGCSVDSDCAEGEFCYNGFCIPGCSDDTNCPLGYDCINGYCLESCSSNAECPEGKICVDGFCFYGCRDDSTCPENYECVDGFCFPLYDTCEEDSQCNPQELCLGGLCIPGPKTCTIDSDCRPDEFCLDGFCVPAFDLPDCGDLDFSDCSAVDGASEGCYYQATSTVLSPCFEGLYGCGDTVPSRDAEQLISAGSYLVKKDGKWTVLCDPPGPGGGGGGGGGGVPSCKPCNKYCNERLAAGIPSPECDGSPTCSDCEVCDGGCCKKPDSKDLPCYCEGSTGCKDCEVCSKEDGGCVAAPPGTCQKCCEVCRPACPGSDFTTKCATYCVDINSPENPCLKAEDEAQNCPPPPSNCETCQSTNVCGDEGETPVCPPGYSNKGFISIGGSTCVICEKCEPKDCLPPDPSEPCDCNCHNDCPDCELCGADGKCYPDPACSDEICVYRYIRPADGARQEVNSVGTPVTRLVQTPPGVCDQYNNTATAFTTAKCDGTTSDGGQVCGQLVLELVLNCSPCGG